MPRCKRGTGSKIYFYLKLSGHLVIGELASVAESDGVYNTHAGLKQINIGPRNALGTFTIDTQTTVKSALILTIIMLGATAALAITHAWTTSQFEPVFDLPTTGLFRYAACHKPCLYKYA